MPTKTLFLTTCLLLSGCQLGGYAVKAAASDIEVLGEGTHCGFATPSLHLVDEGALLPSMHQGVRSAMADTLDAGDYVLVVALGQRPTPGHGAQLNRIETQGNDKISIQLEPVSPAPGSMQAQVITTPCLVLSVPSSGWYEITVSLDAEGFPLSVDRPAR